MWKSFIYTVINATYNVNVQIVNNIPIVASDKKIVRFDMSGSLPLGLIFDNKTGIISGTPLQSMENDFYSISVDFEDQSSTITTIYIAVEDIIPLKNILIYDNISKSYIQDSYTLGLGHYTQLLFSVEEGEVIDFVSNTITGLTYHSNTSKLEGYPSQLGHTDITIKAYNLLGEITRTISVTVLNYCGNVRHFVEFSIDKATVINDAIIQTHLLNKKGQTEFSDKQIELPWNHTMCLEEQQYKFYVYDNVRNFFLIEIKIVVDGYIYFSKFVRGTGGLTTEYIVETSI